MCGIVGFVGNRQAAPILMEGMRRLEYRGYDSAGIATVSGRSLWVAKDIGTLDEVQRKCQLDTIPGNIGIGHVRWATHGAVTITNAHPQVDCKHEVGVVHNGIIDNYQSLKHDLGNHTFISDTDTEVIPHLIEEYLDNGDTLELAVMHTTEQLTGSYAMLVISSGTPSRMVAARNGSPLCVGIGKGVYAAASDPMAMDAEMVAYMEDGDVAVMGDNGVDFYNNGEPIDREFISFDRKQAQISKEDHPHYMLKEILEQPQSLVNALAQDRDTLLAVTMEILQAKQIIFTACGSSRYAALIGQYLFSKLAGKFCDVVMASEFEYFADSVNNGTVVLAISQSGETADVIRGVKKSKERGARIVAVVNMPFSSLERISDYVLSLRCGPEVGVAATKSFTSQLTIFYLLAFALAGRLGEGIDKLMTVSQEVKGFLERQQIKQVAEKIKADHIYYLGRGVNSAMASEAALKAKEVSYIHAEGMPAGELKHGTLALVEQGTPVVAICPHDDAFDETMANVMETKTRGAYVIGISNERMGDEWIEIPTVDEIFYPLVIAPVVQLLAYYLAVDRGLDPDKPRNLAKSVTVK